MSEGSQFITVSREALRADLAELELRLNTFIRDQLDLKASAADVVALAARQHATALAVTRLQAEGSSEAQQALAGVTELREGRLPEAMQKSIIDLIASAFLAHGSQSWALRSNKATVWMVALTVASIVLSLVFTVSRVWF